MFQHAKLGCLDHHHQVKIHTRVMGRVLDLVWYDLNVTPQRRRIGIPIQGSPVRKPMEREGGWEGDELPYSHSNDWSNNVAV